MKIDTSIDVVECAPESSGQNSKKGILRSFLRPGRAYKSSARSEYEESYRDSFGRSESAERVKRSTAIDRKLKEDSRKLRKEVEILVMGDSTGAEAVMESLRLTPSKRQFSSPSTTLSHGSTGKTINGEQTSRTTPDPEDVSEVGLCPSDARLRPTGVQEARIPLGQLSLHITNIQGQQSERKKWMHAFEDVTVIIFIVDLTGYCLINQSSQNCMMASLGLFESTVNSPWFIRTSIILFLNNREAFKDELARTPLKDHFPDYTEGEDTDRAVEYFLRRFKSLSSYNRNL